ncbi:MAG: hypothetical protein D6763_11450 [Alphaproteobacteria bacterium]|nr:MAG: hypothetical protein D6763_11450 [Alphaproteobacteria bacterium]
MSDSRTYLSEAEERRFVLRLLEYWQVLRGARDFPRLADINFNDMGHDSASCAVLTLADPLDETGLVHVGLRLKPEEWETTDQRRLSEVPPDSLLFHMVTHLQTTLQKRVPVSMGGGFTLYGKPVLGRSILLPLSDDGETISHVLGGINYKVVREPVFRDTPRSAPRVAITGRMR